jgi:hypothetical protein
MPVDRVNRDALAKALTQWIHAEISAAVVTDIAAALKNSQITAAKDDRLLGFVAFMWLLKQKGMDGDHLVLLSESGWEDICDYAITLHTDFEMPEEEPEKPAPLARRAMVMVWAILTLVATAWMTYRFGRWGLLTWAIGPIPYILWLGNKWLRRRKRPRAGYLSRSDRLQIQKLRQATPLPPFDPRRFAPSLGYKLKSLATITLGAILVFAISPLVVVTWPMQVSANLDPPWDRDN